MSGPRTLVIGIGSVLRMDDGVGIRVIELLRERDLPDNVRLLDGGTAGLDLLPYLEGADRIIVVDALLSDDPAGTITIRSGEEIREQDVFMSGHFGRLSELLDLAAELWTRSEAIIVGITPKDCESYETALSPEVDEAAVQAADRIAEMVSQLAGHIAEDRS